METKQEKIEAAEWLEEDSRYLAKVAHGHAVKGWRVAVPSCGGYRGKLQALCADGCGISGGRCVMKPIDLSRLQSLRMENVQRGYDMEEKRARFQGLNARHENGTAPQAIAVHQLFQTPAPLAASLVGLLGLRGGERVLEPSAGLGRILDALAPFQPAEVVAVEMAAPCAGALFREEREGVTIKQRDFLAVDSGELGQFDAVAMNPPFTMRADIRHILHALEFLKLGGVLAALCMDTDKRESVLRGMAATWEKVPPGTFSKEGTGVGCVLLSIVKGGGE